MTKKRDGEEWTSLSKQEAVDVRGRLQSPLRHRLYDPLLKLRKTDFREPMWVPLSAFKLHHDQWLAERSLDALNAMTKCVERNPAILGGTPVFRGTRFSVTQFLAEMADSDAVSEFADNYEVDEAMLREFLHALAVHLNQPRL